MRETKARAQWVALNAQEQIVYRAGKAITNLGNSRNHFLQGVARNGGKAMHDDDAGFFIDFYWKHGAVICVRPGSQGDGRDDNGAATQRNVTLQHDNIWEYAPGVLVGVLEDIELRH
jgi:hypothetical protein